MEAKLPMDKAWTNWVACLKSEDQNSIFSQIYRMIWDTAIFKIIFEGRKKQINNRTQDPEINGILHSFIDRNYFQSQSVCVRRLIDTSSGITGEKGIFSLGALIKDLKDYRQELTREKYLELRNMPYDYAEIRKKEMEFIRKQPYGKGFWIPPELDWERIEEAHQTFDRLSGKSPATRQADDVIMERVFVRLQNKLDTCKKFKMYVDKFLAHSASPESRQLYDADMTAITLKNLWDAQRILFEVAEFISLIILYESHMALALEKPSFYDFWDKPLFTGDHEDEVRTILENYRKETEEWMQVGSMEIWEWIEKS